MRTVVHSEGGTKLVVPSSSLAAVPPPKSPVFFNPAARLNRDVTVALTEGTGGITFCDSMAGTGARGLRVAKEVRKVGDVTLVDFNGEALNMARKGARLNGVSRKCEFAESETSSFLYSRYGRDKRFDYVDVDPFGSPIGYVQGALRATADAGILSVTATDTAVLCGVYPKVAMRRYGGASLNNQFNHETAIRLLAGAVVRMAAAVDIGARPIVSHSTKHYVRVYFRIQSGATAAEASLGGIGYVSWCRNCGHTLKETEKAPICPTCGRRGSWAGPLWIGALADQGVLQGSEEAAARKGLRDAAKLLHGLSGSDGYPPWSFSVERICSSLGVATAPDDEVRAKLAELGFGSMRTPYERTGIKTSADYQDVVKAVKAAVEDGNRTRGSDRRSQVRPK